MRTHPQIQQRIQMVSGFLKNGLWQMKMDGLAPSRRFLVHTLRMALVVLRRLKGERVHLRAAGLTFYTLLSIVPVLAMLFGLAKGFGLDRIIETEILRRSEGQVAVVTRLIAFARNLLETTQGGLIAGVGVVVLIWSVISVFGNIEKGLNEIWGISKSRPLLRKVTDYLSLSLLCTLLVAISSTLTVLITTEVTFFVNRIQLLKAVSPLIFIGLKILPITVVWLLFFLIYMAVPNTRVQIRAAAAGGILAGTAFQIFQRVYIISQIGVARYNAIYGSFAALPLFLVWLQVSWLIFLLGAQIAVVIQNRDRLSFDMDPKPPGPGFRRLLSVLVAARVVKRYCSGSGGSGAVSLAAETGIPILLVQDILNDLIACGVLAELKSTPNQEALCLPATLPDHLTISHVLSRLDGLGRDDLPVGDSPGLGQLRESMARFHEAMESSPANLLLKHL